MKRKNLLRKQRRKASKPSKKLLNRKETRARRRAEGWNTVTSTVLAQ